MCEFEFEIDDHHFSIIMALLCGTYSLGRGADLAGHHKLMFSPGLNVLCLNPHFRVVVKMHHLVSTPYRTGSWGFTTTCRSPEWECLGKRAKDSWGLVPKHCPKGRTDPADSDLMPWGKGDMWSYLDTGCHKNSPYIFKRTGCPI